MIGIVLCLRRVEFLRPGADEVVGEQADARRRAYVRRDLPPGVAAHPHHEVAEGEVSEQLPVADEQVQPLVVGLVE